MALFEIRGLRKAFGSHVVLDGLDLDVERGEFLTIIGESGCGKSLLLKLMIGLIPLDGGTLRFDGQDVTRLPEREWVEVRQRVGMLFQASALFDSMSVADNIAYGLREQHQLPEPRILARVSESLARVQLAGIEDRAPGELSGGMRKRVALARAIAMQPEAVLYDEPTEGLDPINVTRVNNLLLDLQGASDITTVVVTHNMRSAFYVSQRVAFLEGGRVLHTGTPDQLRGLGDPRLAPFIAASEVDPLAQAEAELA